MTIFRERQRALLDFTRSSMAIRLLFRNHALSLLLLISLVAGCDDQLSSMPIGAPAKAFVLNHLDGHPVRFPDDYRDQVVAIRFWADWCPYCKNEMAALEPVYRQYHHQGLVILAVNVMQSPATARAFTDRLGISYDVLLDSQGDAMRRYGVMGLPMTFIVDRQGIVRARIIGEATAEIFAQAVKPLL